MLTTDLKHSGAIENPDPEQLAAIAERWRTRRDRDDRDKLILLLSLTALRACRRYRWHPDAQSESMLSLIEFLEAWTGGEDIRRDAEKNTRLRVRRYLDRDRVVRVKRPWSREAGEDYQPDEVDLDSHYWEHPDTRLDVLEVLKPTATDLDLLDRLEDETTYRAISREIGRSTGWINKRRNYFRNCVNKIGYFPPLWGRGRKSSGRIHTNETLIQESFAKTA